MSAPAFTVALAAFNEEDWIGSAIRSVLAQTRDDFELVVVDDGSTDATADVIRGFQTDPRIRLVSQENTGLAGALNAAIAAGTAPYVALIDADDRWMPTYLEEMGRVLDDDPEAGFAYPDAWGYSDPTRRFYRVSPNTDMGAPDPPPNDPEQFLRLLVQSNFVFGLASMRRAAFDEVGGFNEALRACEDYELWIRLLSHGYRATYSPNRLVIVWNRGESMSKDERIMATHIREVCRITIEDLDTSDEVKALARQRIRQMDRVLATLDGRARTRAAWWAVRRRLGAIRRAVLSRRLWYPGTPPEVAAAFPDLAKRES
jgi:glycosyltransferase involved in cell wall biosynthesis